MEQISEYVDERQQSWCIHCSGWIAHLSATKDHVPSKGLLLTPYPENLPVIAVCRECNTGFSLDEEYLVALLGAVLTGSADPGDQINPTARRILGRKAALRARIESGKREYRTLGGDTRVVWAPEWDRVERVIVKNARGHVFYELGEPVLSPPTHAWAAPIASLSPEQAHAFHTIEGTGIWGEVGSRMLMRQLTGLDIVDGWIQVQKGIYRYAVDQSSGMLVRSIVHEYLATEVYWSH